MFAYSPFFRGSEDSIQGSSNNLGWIATNTGGGWRQPGSSRPSLGTPGGAPAFAGPWRGAVAVVGAEAGGNVPGLAIGRQPKLTPWRQNY